MENYESNSHRSKEEKKDILPEKKVEKIVNGAVKSKKKNGLQKITNAFVPEDVESVKSYIFEDIVVPAVKDIILDTCRTFLGLDKNSRRDSIAAKVEYRNRYGGNVRENTRRARIGSGYDYNDIILDNRGEAEEVLLRMDELIETYGLVSVADLYDLVGVTGSYTDNKYGWTDIRMGSVIRVRDGYMIKLPKASPIS